MLYKSGIQKYERYKLPVSFCFQIITKCSIVVGQNHPVHRMNRTSGHNLITLALPMKFFYYLSIEMVLQNYLVILKISLLEGSIAEELTFKFPFVT